MPRFALFFLALFIASASVLFIVQPTVNQKISPQTALLISPNVENELISLLSSANSSLDAELYLFSYSPLKKTLVDLVKNGVSVRVILEPKITANLETAEFLSTNGVSVRWASQKFANTHSKAILLDEKCLIAGSINWSRHAIQENREIALYSCDKDAAREFSLVFEEDWRDATQVN